MQEKKSCCHFFRKFFSKSPQPAPTKTPSKAPQDKTEISIPNKTFSTEPKPKSKKPAEPSISNPESDPNSIFYDRNSALIESVDQKKAISNLEVAFEIINHSDDSFGNSLNGSHSDQFTKVVKGINFKKILEGEDSIISDRSKH